MQALFVSISTMLFYRANNLQSITEAPDAHPAAHARHRPLPYFDQVAEDGVAGRAGLLVGDLLLEVWYGKIQLFNYLRNTVLNYFPFREIKRLSRLCTCSKLRFSFVYKVSVASNTSIREPKSRMKFFFGECMNYIKLSNYKLSIIHTEATSSIAVILSRRHLGFSIQWESIFS